MSDDDLTMLDCSLATLRGRKVLFVMAAEAEYGAALKARIRPLMTGVGPVEAALGTGIALHALQAAGHLPDLVVSLGSAGSRSLEQGAVYQVASVSWRDIDASPLGFAKGVTPFLDHPVDTPLPAPIPSLAAARLSTGANIVSGAAYDAIDADMVDMETFAVLRACQRFSLPLVGLRGISDGAADLHHYDDWATLLHVIDAKLADAVDRLEITIDSGLLAL
ncbi:5'-methylthioadenosine/S-adenosylhomocysteine nucleosidase [Jiella sp. MQZ9-1]|uniref:5'-methylthioadenosine/S-adenosylhomocysteine nucleosidase n=1 Tax=Jiella flava TaxID=2816857 RepID=A0A939JTU5_9HYPH|nr:5'-methylthioadenosine/S-adenosylhomocysteine nucleosidase [Jiella flava]MBO0662495.1 5'-methylthioadenosine/S-adenosylhomocysteine nucleosidase [Jiella flava]MCD2471720.1 5'-methylthioadenosine/S-adenosylhomocysteine nucleosidase [Jiella flava]